MAEVTPLEPAWLARTFVECELLPDLLALPGTAGTDMLPESWTTWPLWEGCNLEHMTDDEMPAENDLTSWLAADAWGLVRQLELVDANRLTPAGQRIADIADIATDRRLETGQLQTLFDVLAEQVQTCYLGVNDFNITDLLLRGADTLARTGHVWAAYCPGLLLVEFDALVRLAGTDPDRAEQLIAELEMNRDYAMHPYDTPSPDILPMENMVIHADAVSTFYFDDLQLLPDDTLNLSAARATAMLYTFTGLLREVYPIGPVQCLAPEAEGKDT